MDHVADLDQTERDARATLATTLVEPLRQRGVVGVATTFVDNSGVARVKAVPLDRLPHLAAWGVGGPSVDRLLGIIERRCVTNRNGATWFIDGVADREEAGDSRPEALRRSLLDYLDGMHANEPVHTWG